MSLVLSSHAFTFTFDNGGLNSVSLLLVFLPQSQLCSHPETILYLLALRASEVGASWLFETLDHCCEILY